MTRQTERRARSHPVSVPHAAKPLALISTYKIIHVTQQKQKQELKVGRSIGELHATLSIRVDGIIFHKFNT